MTSQRSLWTKMSDVLDAVRIDTWVAWWMKTAAAVPGVIVRVFVGFVEKIIGGRVQGALEYRAREEAEDLTTVVDGGLGVGWTPERYSHREVR
jgi:hypothetical protein